MSFTREQFFGLCDHCGAVVRGPSGPQPHWNDAARAALSEVTGDVPRGREMAPQGLHPDRGPSYVGGTIESGPHAGEEEPISHGAVCPECQAEWEAWYRAALARYQAQRRDAPEGGAP